MLRSESAHHDHRQPTITAPLSRSSYATNRRNVVRPPSCETRVILSHRPRYNLIELFSKCEGSRAPPGSGRPPPSPPDYDRNWGRKRKTGACLWGDSRRHPSLLSFLRSPRILRFRGGDNANKRNARSAGAVRTGSSIPSFHFRFLSPPNRYAIKIESRRHLVCRHLILFSEFILSLRTKVASLLLKEKDVKLD